MTTSTDPVSIPWEQGGESGILSIKAGANHHLDLNLGEKGHCRIPLSVIKPLMIAFLQQLERQEPSPHWSEAENHFQFWNKYRERRLANDFQKFVAIFVYLSSFEFQRTKNSIRQKLKELSIRDLLP